LDLLTLTHSARDYSKYNATDDLHALQFTVKHALGFSLFTSRILATDLSQSHFNFKSHMKYSCQSLISFFSINFDCHFQNPTHFLITSSNDLLYPFITLRQGPLRKHSLSIVEKACLLIRCLGMDILLLRAYAST
jgi:hypothetical protein